MKIRGDTLIQGLCYRNTDAIIDVKLGDTDTDNYRFELMVTLMA